MRRLPLVAGAMVAMVVGIWGGLGRLGWSWAVKPAVAVGLHGPLMVCGFLGVLIAVERAVARDAWWAWSPPIVGALGASLLVVAHPLAPWILFLAGVLLTVVLLESIRLHPSLDAGLMVAAAGALAASTLLWAVGRPVSGVVLGWALFLILTIAAERLEMSRMLPPRRWSLPLFGFAAGLLTVGWGVHLLDPGGRVRLFAVGLLSLVVWLSLRDIGRRTIRAPGLPRFVAICVFGGYLWLALSGVLMFALGALTPGMGYDAALHGIFLGFAFSMIFGHGPIVFPAVLGVSIPFSRRFYIHLALLHGGLGLRWVGGLASLDELRRVGGLISAMAIALFLLQTLFAARTRGRDAAAR